MSASGTASPTGPIGRAADVAAEPCPLDNPESELTPLSLGRQVVTCRSAADAKGVALERELKSLLIACDRGLLLAHVRGSRRLSLRAVKRTLKSRQARLADPSVLAGLRLHAGVIHPFHRALWGGLHLVAGEVLAMPWVTTNAGKLDAYVRFDPAILLRARYVVIGDFEE